MAAKGILILCAQALFIQCTTTQRLGRDGFASTYELSGRNWGCNINGVGRSLEGVVPGTHITPTSGGSLPVDSASAIPPVGVSVASENVYEGTLTATGELPFIGTVGIEGVLPTAGTGYVNYGCGSTPTITSIGGAPVSTSAISSGLSTGLNGDVTRTSGVVSSLSGYGPSSLGVTATSGGRLPVSSSSAIPPVGVSVASENLYEGTLTATGELPFVGTVSIEGIMPTAGTGVVNHSCGTAVPSITAVVGQSSYPGSIISSASASNVSPVFNGGALSPATRGVSGPFNGFGATAIGSTATSGGRLPVTSASAVPPVGVAVASENVYEGILAAAGELPFVGTVGAEGVQLPTAGVGMVNHSCGNGATAMATTRLGHRGFAGRKCRY